MSSLVIGVLALQGAFQKHIEMFQKLKVDAIEVRSAKDLENIHGLVIPGGESTAILKHLFLEKEMKKKLGFFVRENPVFGTCAGLILLSKEVLREDLIPLNVLDVTVERNAYGRQVDSFMTTLSLHLPDKKPLTIPAIFIRAPRIKRVGKDVKVLSSFKDEPVLVQQEFLLGSTFHPELTDSPVIHQYFIDLVKQKVVKKKS